MLDNSVSANVDIGVCVPAGLLLCDEAERVILRSDSAIQFTGKHNSAFFLY